MQAEVLIGCKSIIRLRDLVVDLADSSLTKYLDFMADHTYC